MSNHTRAERIKKLGNSIRRYRGEYRPSLQIANKPIQWLTPPDPSEKENILKWLRSLGYSEPQIDGMMLKIGEASLKCDSGFKNHDEFGAFMRELK